MALCSDSHGSPAAPASATLLARPLDRRKERLAELALALR